MILAIGIDQPLELADHRSPRPALMLALYPVTRPPASAPPACACRDAAHGRSRSASASAASGARRLRLRQQHADHHLDLLLVGMADADHRLLDEVGGIFGDAQARHRRHHQRDAARLAELQRRLRIAVDEGLLDRRLVRREDPRSRRRCPSCNCRSRSASGRVPSLSTQPQPTKASLVPSRDDHAPAGLPKAGIETEDANRWVMVTL